MRAPRICIVGKYPESIKQAIRELANVEVEFLEEIKLETPLEEALRRRLTCEDIAERFAAAIKDAELQLPDEPVYIPDLRDAIQRPTRLLVQTKPHHKNTNFSRRRRYARN